MFNNAQIRRTALGQEAAGAGAGAGAESDDSSLCLSQQPWHLQRKGLAVQTVNKHFLIGRNKQTDHLIGQEA